MPSNLQPFKDLLQLPELLPPQRVTSDGTHYYRIEMKRGERNIHAQLEHNTPFWGYEGLYPGPTIEVPKASKVVVEFVNSLPLLATGQNPRSQWPFGYPKDLPDVAMPVFAPPQPWTVVHLHGSPSPSDSDGWPDNAYFPGGSQTHHYPAQENAALFWYHDHANMITRLNVYAGLAGFYIVRDPEAESHLGLPIGKDAGEIPILIQDRNLEVDTATDMYTGRFAYHELNRMDPFKGQYRLANGTIAPFAKVQPREYRLRILNGCNGRILRLTLRPDSGQPTTAGLIVVGVDGGFLRDRVSTPTTTPLATADDPDPVAEQVLVLAPAERVDVLVDFGRYAGKPVLLFDESDDPSDAAPVVRFDVAAAAPSVPTQMPTLPERFRSHRSPGWETLSVLPRSRPIGLYHAVVMRAEMHTINGRLFHDAPEEAPVLDTEEIWEFVNITVDEHPIHLHLVNFDVLDRRAIQITDPTLKTDLGKLDRVFRAWRAVDPATRSELPPGLDWNGKRTPADAYERMFKDTVRVPGRSVTRIHVKFRLRTGTYMYHCHLLDHEDMEMMRPLIVVPRGLHLMTTPCQDHAHGGHGGHPGH